MLVKDFMTRMVVWCTPWDTAQTAAERMKTHSIGALPVVVDSSDPLLEGILTDRDLCCSIVASGEKSNAIHVGEVMTPIPVTCKPESTLADCQELMRENQVRRLPVVNERGRCVGIVTQTDIAWHAPSAELAATIREISRLAKSRLDLRLEPGYFYCGQLHEEDQIALLTRRRESITRQEVLT